MRFKKTGERHEVGDFIEEYEMELRPGHTITRVDHTSRLGAGRKGRAAEVNMYRVMTCTCGAHLGYGGLTVSEDLANLRHFESAQEREDYEAEQERLVESIQRSLGVG